MFEHGGAKLVSRPGRHLTSLRPCLQGKLVVTFRLHGITRMKP